ncbi:hypothetical protein [Alteromonas stellipolaris]|uniref:hypothetical protein n=1 Tax=Alteromonas stellipolaris TaxID=233316 RepID=UPI0030F54A2D
MALKYEFATLRDEKGDKKIIYASKLKNSSISQRLKIKEMELYDESEEYRVYPRFNEKSPHFYSKSSKVRAYDKNNKDKSPKHDERVKSLVKKLNEMDCLDIGYYLFEKKEKYFESLVRIKNYHWEAEVSRIIDSKTRVQHDIYGAELSLSMSQRKPFIAIEVVKTHFPEKNTFESLLKLSKEIPLIVIFDFTVKKNYYCELVKDGKRLRINNYIYDGALWDRDKKTKVTTQDYALEYFKKNGYIDHSKDT